ncbi:MAG: hypothetical protein ACI9VM_000141 [Candidatus Azotimanducaceae bacterium]|jgi:hypothetical protein
MYKNISFGVLFLVVVYVVVQFFGSSGKSGEAINVRPVANSVQLESDDDSDIGAVDASSEDFVDAQDAKTVVSAPPKKPIEQIMSQRELFTADEVNLPVAGSAPSKNIKHSIPIDEIRQGCFRQDCIPSVDDPEFVSVKEANKLLPDDTVGIALSYKGEDRFYPFNMLVTREIVNDVVAGDPLLVTYCPLCGTGIVFDRSVEGAVYEFGVSGMLWQSNLLMYNRADDIEDRNLWSQVLGEAVVGEKTGVTLNIVPSDIAKYINWAKIHKNGSVLNTGSIGDPYNGNYFGVAQRFGPNFDAANSPLDPSAYVYGVSVDGKFKAYPLDSLPSGVTTDTIGNTSIIITKSDDGIVNIVDTKGTTVPDVEGFWFSWVAAHPETELWQK